MVLDCAAARSRDTEIRRADLRSEPKAVLARSPPIRQALRKWWLNFLYIAINGINGLCITKLDILDGMEKLKVCIAYEYRCKRTEYAPLDAAGWDECTPVYLELPGWEESTAGMTEWERLPPAARAYLRALEELAGCELAIVSTGPRREATMVLRDPFA